jgi:cytochrome c5
MSQTSASASEADEHSSFIKTPRQLIVVVLLAFLVPIFGIALVLQIVVGGNHAEPGALSHEAVSARLQPVGRVEVVDADAPRVLKSAEEIVKTTCMACHGAGVAGAPKIGDKVEWGKRAKLGLDAMLKIAIAGKGAMPPRGGLPDLSDYELAQAIVYMANQSGASLKEPAAPAAAAPVPVAGPVAKKSK